MRRRRVAFSSDLRHRALKRAGLAIAAALALLLAVLWYGDSDTLSQSPKQPLNAASEQLSGFMPNASTPDLPLEPGTAESDEPIETPVPVEAELVPGTEAAATLIPPPESPKVADISTPPQKATDAPAPQKVADAPTSQKKITNDTPTGATKPISLPDGYFVQLGVFNDTENVGRMFENVTALGMSAHVQSYIVVGPFRNKREAEAARNRLKDIAEGTVLPPQKTEKSSRKPKAKPKSRQRTQ